ncbi:hypothetical protein NCCP1664_01870 [Zafaria cholistanensis]|uniref:Lectin n=1 Tax=Zafaria cholistanensis TaxID=1682741 RepID=A0A5A7NLP2_9MICC|nr:hypothetical protein [Zafaria cholistanensis]GER21690.1 hypothetical protein NCCP1664_01870 [Zafaria cholistanensis]
MSDGTGYAWVDTGQKIRNVEFEMRRTGTELNVVLALATTNNVIDNLVHFTVNNRQIIVDFLTGGSWSTDKQPGYVLNYTNRLLNGRTYRVRLSVEGETATVTGPHKEQFSFADNRIKNNAASSLFLEPMGAASGRHPAVLRVTAGKAPKSTYYPWTPGTSS